jgi:excisionase family DNA binding protein
VDFYTMDLSVPEAARRASRSPETIRRWIWSGRLPSRRVGNQHVLASDDVDAVIGGQPQDGAEWEDVPGPWGEWLGLARQLQESLRLKSVRGSPGG